jgi:hypothetical protein
VTVVIAGIDLARYVTIHTAADSASREATRYGSAVGTVSGTPRYVHCSGIRAAAKNAAVNLPLADSDIIVSYERWNATTSTWEPLAVTCPVSGTAATADDIERMDRIVVRVTTRFSPTVNLLQAIDVVSTDHRTIVKKAASP